MSCALSSSGRRRRFVVRVPSLALLALVGTLGTIGTIVVHVHAAAAAPTHWSITPSPNRGAGANELTGVACTSSTFCMAVGSYTASAGVREGLIESWNGANWSMSPMPNEVAGTFSAIACTSPMFCMAVGTYNSGSTLAETWNGDMWSVTPAGPSLSNVGYGFNSVSCTTPSFCMAVGYYNFVPAFPPGITVPNTMTEHWNGSNWTYIQSIEDAMGSTFNGVSCSSSSNCVAVGALYGSTVLIESWKGTTWTLVSTQSRVSGLLAVSCVSPAACAAVGGSSLAFWNGTAWSYPASQTYLNAASCTGPSNCVAVGGPEIDAWNGTKWTMSVS